MWRRRGLAALGLLLACAGGCRPEAGLPAFPIGLYSAFDPAELPRIKDAGFDHVFIAGKPEALPALAGRARDLGLGVILGPEGPMRGPAAATLGWPVAGWYLQDEPEVNGVSPEMLAEKSRRVRAWDPGRAQVFVIGQGSAAKDYAGVGDALMLDWYPVPHLALDSVETQIDLARSFLPKGKPLWFVVQAMDWRDDPPRIPGHPQPGRFPDHAEIRFMSWAAVLHEAQGLFYFRLHRPDGTTLFDYPEFWQAVERVSLEMRAFKPVLVRGKRVGLPFSREIEGLEARSWRRHLRQYVVIANRRETETLMPSELVNPHWRPLFEARRNVAELVRCDGDGCWLRPHQVLVLESRLWPF